MLIFAVLFCLPADVCNSDDDDYEDVDDGDGEDDDSNGDAPDSKAASDDEDEVDDGSDAEEVETGAYSAGEDNVEVSPEEEARMKNSKVELEKLMEKSGGTDTLFPPLDGTGFYMTTCKINHSCDPNVFVRYNQHPMMGLVLELVAIRDIQEGEELLQSYIDQAQSKVKRQKALRDYGFSCRCTKCVQDT